MRAALLALIERRGVLFRNLLDTVKTQLADGRAGRCDGSTFSYDPSWARPEASLLKSWQQARRSLCARGVRLRDQVRALRWP